MTTKGMITALAITALAASVASQTQTGSKAVDGKGETTLVGITIMDSGLRVVNVYGSPDEIQPLSFGSGSVGPSGNDRGPAGAGPAGPGGGGGGGGGGAASGSGSLPPPPMGGKAGISDNGFGFGNDALMAQGLGLPGGRGGGGQGGRRGLAGGDDAGGGPAAAGVGGGGAGPAGAGSGSNESVTYTRWVYNRGGSRYGFVIDKFNRVVQIEAIGVTDPKVRTKKGVGFGADFATLMRKYLTPDGYDIAGDSLVVRYLVRSKVAFRMTRVEKDKPFVVTGIVVAAGKA